MRMGDRFSAQAGEVRVLLADDQRLLLDLVTMFLGTTGGFHVTQAGCADDVVLTLRDNGPFDVVLLNIALCGPAGPAGLRRFVDLAGGAPVAVVAANASPRLADEVIAAGAAGLLPMSMPLRSLANAIRFMQAGERYMPLDFGRADTGPSRPGDLSTRERHVLTFLSEGRPNKGIANALRLAEPTVKMHVTAICRKLGAANRTQAALMAREKGLV